MYTCSHTYFMFTATRNNYCIEWPVVICLFLDSSACVVLDLSKGVLAKSLANFLILCLKQKGWDADLQLRKEVTYDA